MRRRGAGGAGGAAVLVLLAAALAVAAYVASERRRRRRRPERFAAAGGGGAGALAPARCQVPCSSCPTGAYAMAGTPSLELSWLSQAGAGADVAATCVFKPNHLDPLGGMLSDVAAQCGARGAGLSNALDPRYVQGGTVQTNPLTGESECHVRFIPNLPADSYAAYESLLGPLDARSTTLYVALSNAVAANAAAIAAQTSAKAALDGEVGALTSNVRDVGLDYGARATAYSNCVVAYARDYTSSCYPKLTACAASSNALPERVAAQSDAAAASLAEHGATKRSMADGTYVARAACDARKRDEATRASAQADQEWAAWEASCADRVSGALKVLTGAGPVDLGKPFKIYHPATNRAVGVTGDGRLHAKAYDREVSFVVQSDARSPLKVLREPGTGALMSHGMNVLTLQGEGFWRGDQPHGFLVIPVDEAGRPGMYYINAAYPDGSGNTGTSYWDELDLLMVPGAPRMAWRLRNV